MADYPKYFKRKTDGAVVVSHSPAEDVHQKFNGAVELKSGGKAAYEKQNGGGSADVKTTDGKTEVSGGKK